MEGPLPAEKEWMSHLSQTYSLPVGTLERLWEEFLAHSEVTVEQYAVRRHFELQSQGWQNQAIFELLQKELTALRFKAPSYTLRQIRRMIYG